jgi:hypothetical protein
VRIGATAGTLGTIETTGTTVIRLNLEPVYPLIENVPFAPLYRLNEIYDTARNIAWKGTPDNQILAATMKID